MKKITVMRWLGSAVAVLFLMMLIVNYCNIGFDVALYDDYGIHGRSNPFTLVPAAGRLDSQQRFNLAAESLGNGSEERNAFIKRIIHGGQI